MDKIVIDGGPCGGKTTGLAHAREFLIKNGFYPLIVSEAPTILKQSGIHPLQVGNLPFQHKVVELQLFNEAFFEKQANMSAKALKKVPILLLDRGLLSGAAYLGHKNLIAHFERSVLFNFGLTVEDVRHRYKGVVHMITAALGAPEYYTRDNNTAREEDLMGAILQCNKSKEVWLGHPHFSVVGNVYKDRQITFDEKIKKVVGDLCRHIGFPVPYEIEDKFKLKYFDPQILQKNNVPFQKIEIEQTYLISGDPKIEERVRKRTWMHQEAYFHTKKIGEGDMRQEPADYPISKMEYISLLQRKDFNKRTIYKDRYCFLWEDQYFEADVLHGDLSGKFYLEREKTDRNESTLIPSFLDVSEDVSNNSSHKMAMLARL